jgi:hypothetical protein
MAADVVKCPHCFGEKPAAALVCLHCGRDAQGFGPMVRSSQSLMVPDNAVHRSRRVRDDLNVHTFIAVLALISGFLLMLSSAVGSLLFAFGIILLVITRIRAWWRHQRPRLF